MPICFKFVDYCDGVQVNSLGIGGSEWYHFDCVNNSPMDAKLKPSGTFTSNCGTNGNGIARSSAPNGPGDYYFIADTPLDGTLDMHQGIYPNGACWIPALAYTLQMGICTGGAGLPPSVPYYSDGSYPVAALIEDSDGFLYGTTIFGGANGQGVIFKLKKDGTGFQTLHDFDSADPANGAYPYKGLLEASDGDLYGTTHEGGANGVGVVFKLNKNGTGFQNIHNFSGNGVSSPDAPAIAIREPSDIGVAQLATRILR